VLIMLYNIDYVIVPKYVTSFEKSDL